jgi:hypothetical protein
LNQAWNSGCRSGSRAERGEPGALDQVREAGIALDREAEHHGVDERAEHAAQLRAVARGHRGADREVVLAGVAVQQRGVAGEQDHVQGRAGRPGQLVQRAHQRGLHGLREGGAVADAAAPRAIGGQRQAVGRAVEPLLPVRQLALGDAVVERLALADRVVGVLQRGRGQRGRRALGAVAGVQRGQLVDQQRERPAVPDQVVQGHQQYPLAGVDRDQTGAQQRPVLEVERAARLVDRELVHRARALPVDPLEHELRLARRRDDLLRPTIDDREPRAQHGMAADDVAQRALERVDPQPAAQAHPARHVEAPGAGLELRLQPDALLGPRQRRAPELGGRCGRRR